MQGPHLRTDWLLLGTFDLGATGNIAVITFVTNAQSAATVAMPPIKLTQEGIFSFRTLWFPLPPHCVSRRKRLTLRESFIWKKKHYLWPKDEAVIRSLELVPSMQNIFLKKNVLIQKIWNSKTCHKLNGSLFHCANKLFQVKQFINNICSHFLYHRQNRKTNCW